MVRDHADDDAAALSARRRAVVVAGHRGDVAAARAGLDHPAAEVRLVALGACARAGVLSDADVAAALHDLDAGVRRRAAELAATRAVDLTDALHDVDASVVEQAAWSAGEQAEVSDGVVIRLIELATGAPEPLVRESAAAALGARGDVRGLGAILAACRDVPAVRRRAVLALAPFDGPQVEDALAEALTDRDWQVRQAAEDLVRARGG